MFIINWGELVGRIDPTAYKKASGFYSKAFIMAKMSNVINVNPIINFDSIDEEDDISFIPMDAVDENFGEIKYKYVKRKKERKGFTKFAEGDLLWAKITPCMQNGKSAVAKNLINGVGCGSTEFFVIRPKTNDVIINYLHVILREERTLKNAENFFGGSAGQQRVSKVFLEELKIPIPPVVIQQQIVDIMDAAYEEKRQKETQAHDLLDSINSYLLGELGITMPPEEESFLASRIFYVNSSNVLGGRLDPKKYTNKYHLLFLAIENAPYNKKYLRELIISDASGNWGLDETVKGEDLISCLTIRATEFDNRYNLDLDNNRTKYRKYKEYIYEKIRLSPNDILIEKSGGSDDQPVGRVAFIEKEMSDKHRLAFSNFIHKITVKEDKVDPRYLFEYLRLMHNIKVTEVMQTQTNGIRNLIMHEYLTQTIILPEINTQKRIALHASNLRQQAKGLEAEADGIVRAAKAKVEKILLEGSI